MKEKTDAKKQQEKITQDAKINKRNEHYAIGENLRDIYVKIETLCVNLSKKEVRKLYILEENILDSTKHSYLANFLESKTEKMKEIDYARASLEVCDNIIFQLMESNILPKKKLSTLAYKISIVRSALKKYKITLLNQKNYQENKFKEIKNEKTKDKLEMVKEDINLNNENLNNENLNLQESENNIDLLSVKENRKKKSTKNQKLINNDLNELLNL